MCARCAEVLSATSDPSGIRFLRIVEHIDGFVLQRFGRGGESLGDLQFETMDDAMRYVYSEYEEPSEWKPCPDDG